MSKKVSKGELDIDELFEEALVLEDEIIFESDQLFFIPNNWTWVNLDNMATKITDGVHSTPLYVSEGVPFLSVSNLSMGSLSFKSTKYITLDDHKILIKRCYPEPGDLLMGKVGTLGCVDIVPTGIEFSVFVQLALFKPQKEKIDSNYLANCIKCDFFQQQIQKNASGTTMRYIGIGKIKNLMIPLPPLSEQKRIVERVDSLLGKLEQIKNLLVDLK